MYDICIIGGGASGMTAAVTAAKENENIKVCILEKKEAPGRKLLATGNGRCNISNVRCEGRNTVLDFLTHIGIITRTDDEGRIYPYSLQGSQVVDVLLKTLESCGVELKGKCSVTDVIKEEGCFKVTCENGSTVRAKKLLIASGGKAGPQYGTAGDGYKWAKAMGHSVTRLAPVLTALECEGDFERLKGIRSKAEVYLFKDQDMIGRERGEIQFTADGLSGICIFNMSREMLAEPGEKLEDALKRYKLNIDFIPDISEEAFINVLKEKQQNTEMKGWELLETAVSTELAKFIAEKAGREDAHALAAAAKYWDVNVTGIKGWKQAQCTSGGVVLDEVDAETQMSKIVKDLYFAGEILDYDGPCGGFNLNHAIYTGIIAGKAMADVL